MKTIRLDAGELLLALSREELAALNNALNYVTNGVDLGADFSSVIGLEPKEARRLLRSLRTALAGPAGPADSAPGAPPTR